MMTITINERLLGGLWGGVVGDALGVPVEFISREERRWDPVISLRGGGTWRQPAGTWSDDTSLALCAVESLINGFDTTDMGHRFVEWMRAERWTPWGKVFDIGGTTQSALAKIAGGTAAEEAGGTSEHSNGNGSLMRILPVALAGANQPVEILLDWAHRASAITHAHQRSQMACGFVCLFAQELIGGRSADEAYVATVRGFRDHYRGRPWTTELAHFDKLLEGKADRLPETEIGSSGYVLDTLTASVWCLLNTTTFNEAVLKAVNLGGDTDTTGCVTGGLAGLTYGRREIPDVWLNAMARRSDIDLMFTEFVELLTNR